MCASLVMRLRRTIVGASDVGPEFQRPPGVSPIWDEAGLACGSWSADSLRRFERTETRIVLMTQFHAGDDQQARSFWGLRGLRPRATDWGVVPYFEHLY